MAAIFDPNIFLQGAQMRQQDRQRAVGGLYNTLMGIAEKKEADLKAQKAQAQDPAYIAQQIMLGNQVTPEQQAILDYSEMQATRQRAIDPFGRVYQKNAPLDLRKPQSAYDTLIGQKPQQQPETYDVLSQPMQGGDMISPQGIPRDEVARRNADLSNVKPVLGAKEQKQLPEIPPLQVKNPNTGNPMLDQTIMEEQVKSHYAQINDRAKSIFKENEKIPAREEFDRELATVLETLDKLKEQGGTVSQNQGVLKNVGSMMANAPFVGGVAQTALDPETQTLRNIIDGKRPRLFNAIKKASGLTGTELNSQFEVENQLKQLGNEFMTYEARVQLLRDLSSAFGTGNVDKYLQKQPQNGGWSIKKK